MKQIQFGKVSDQLFQLLSFYHSLLSDLNQSDMQQAKNNWQNYRKGGMSSSSAALQQFNQIIRQRSQHYYKQFQAHLRQDIEQQKADIINRQSQQNRLIRIKQQLIDQLKGLDQQEIQLPQDHKKGGADNKIVVKNQQKERQIGQNNRRGFDTQKTRIEEQIRHEYQQKMSQDRESYKHLQQQYALLKMEIQHLRNLYFEMAQKMSAYQSATDHHDPHKGYKSTEAMKRFASSLLIKLQNLLNEKDGFCKTIKKLQEQIMQIKQQKKSKGILELDDKKLNQLLKSYQQNLILKQQLTQSKKTNQTHQKQLDNQKNQLEISIFVRDKQIKQYEHIITDIRLKLAKAEKEVVRLEVELKQFQQLKQQSNILKMRLFGWQNLHFTHPLHSAHTNQNISPVITNNLPKLARSQILNNKLKNATKSLPKRKRELLLSAEQGSHNIRQLQSRLIEEGSVHAGLMTKLKSYKKKITDLQNSLKDVEIQHAQSSQRSKKKINQYNALIHRLQSELEKAYLINSEISHKTNSDYIEQIQFTNTQTALLIHKFSSLSSTISQEREEREKERSSLNAEIQRLQKINSQLQLANRQSKKLLLQQKLSMQASRVGNNKDQSQNSKAIAFSLSKQVTLLKSQLEQNKDILLKQTARCERLAQLSSSQSAQIESANLQIKQLRLKPQSAQPKSGEKLASLQLSQLKSKLQMQLRRNQVSQKRIREYEKQTQLYQGRVEELQQALRMLANANEVKAQQVRQINEENAILNDRVDNLEEEFDLLRGKASSLRQIEFMNRSSELEGEVQALKKQVETQGRMLEIRERELENLQKQCENFEEDNFKLMFTLQEHGLQVKENIELTGKYEQERSQKIKHLQVKVESLKKDNEVLKQLVEQLRLKLLEKDAANPSFSASSPNLSELQQLKNLLSNKQSEVVHYQNEVQELQDLRKKEKNEWDRMINEFNVQAKLLKTYQDNLRQIGKPDIRTSGDINDRFYQMKAQLEKKDQVIKRLENQLAHNDIGSAKDKTAKDREFFFKEGTDAGQEYKYSYNQLAELRQEVHKLKQNKFLIQDRLRDLQQQNSSLKVKLIAHDRFNKNSKDLSSPPVLSAEIEALPLQFQSRRSNRSRGDSLRQMQSVNVSPIKGHTSERKDSENFRELAAMVPLVESVRVRGDDARMNTSAESKGSG